MRYVYEFSNIIKYSESVRSPSRRSKLNLGVHQVTSFLHFSRKIARWRKVPCNSSSDAPRDSQLFHVVKILNIPWGHFLSGGRYLTPPGLFASGSRSKTGSLELIIFINHANFWTNDEFERCENCHHNLILE